MGLLPGDRHVVPPHSLYSGHDADRVVTFFENGALFDMRFEVVANRSISRHFRPRVSNSEQFFTENITLHRC